METEHIILDNFKHESNSDIEPLATINLTKFIILSIVSFGLYELWWIYKSWRFFKQKEKLDIMPAARAIFSIFFLNSLFNKILHFAASKGYEKSYSSTPLVVGFFIINTASKLPQPYWVISGLSFLFLIPPFQALNFAFKNSTDFETNEQVYFNYRQIILLLVGLALWSLVIYAMTL